MAGFVSRISMRVIVDNKNPLVEEAFRQFGDVQPLSTLEITRDAVRDADMIIIRSETKVNKDLLEGSKVKFVGTATIGTDHVDLEYLSSHKIGFASAPGSNANSVAEYFVAAMLMMAKRKGFTLSGKKLGVVGVGNAGSKVVRNAKALGLEVLQNDPPLARATHNPVFLSLDELMQADIITVHVPLTKNGSDPTYHLFDESRIAKMKRGAILMNTARGSVVDGGALKNSIEQHHLGGIILDVWEGEPIIDVDLVSKVDLGTPHIAGYSYDGKLAAVKMTYVAACTFFRQTASWTPGNSIPNPAVGRIVVPPNSKSKEEALLAIVSQCYDIKSDDGSLRGIANVKPDERRQFFQRLRAGYGIRREFFNSTVELSPAWTALAEPLRAIGFCVKVGGD
jgi:erythronate-4-phosphate dehydrogenase